MKIYPQGEPNTIKLEPTEGCTLACWFCGIKSIRDNGADYATQTHGEKSSPFKFMTLETIRLIVLGVLEQGWNPRWEIAGRGEPSMNVNLEKIVECIRTNLPDATIILTTNASGLYVKTHRIQALFDAGVNTMAIDNYNHSPFAAPIIKFLENGGTEYPIGYYPQQNSDNPYRRTKAWEKRVVILRDLTEGGGVRNQIHNQGGSSGGPKKMVHAACSKPFRDLTMRWDGRMALCCDDWPGHYKVGSIHDTPLIDLWRSPAMEAARRHLLIGDRKFKPCAGCDVITKRNGLLPDRMGKDKGKMLPPDEESTAIARAAASGSVQTPKL